MVFDEKVEAILSDLNDDAKAALKKELQKAIKRDVKKKIRKRRKRFVRTVIVVGVAAGAGYLIYKNSDKVKKTVDDAVETVTSKLPMQPAEAASKVKAIIIKK